ncbi:hypothetical protein M513_12711 [Trichuris suis]|uniref:MULE transposase domain-containing protein n=1 Tax=Trichuris suis TaxID=68888 RepID=A0A085LN62_9BILA|nr:hypothetical protein M513_12711 [Trichuris suis]
MLIFASKADIEKLSAASLWIMDGTFKTVPRLFYQLYTIHGALQTSRFSIFPLVYILMTGKSEEPYRRVFQELGDFGERNELHLRPSVIMTDLELSAINAARTEFPGTSGRATNNVLSTFFSFPDAMNKACFFHSSQCVWRKIQSCDLASTYADDENFSLATRHLTALALLRFDEIPEAFEELKPYLPEEAHEVTEWFAVN